MSDVEVTTADMDELFAFLSIFVDEQFAAVLRRLQGIRGSNEDDA